MKEKRSIFNTADWRQFWTKPQARYSIKFSFNKCNYKLSQHATTFTLVRDNHDQYGIVRGWGFGNIAVFNNSI